MIDAADRALMEETVRAAIAGADGREAVDRVLAQIGWLDMLDAEPSDAIEIVFSALGAANATATALDDVIASALGAKARADLAVLLPRFAAWDPPGRLDAGGFRARWPRHGSRRHGAARCWWYAARRRSHRVSPFRWRLRRFARCAGSIPTPAFTRSAWRRSGGVAARLDPAAWHSAVALGRRAVAHQMAGASRAMLALARTHATGAGAVRSPDRALPGRAPPPRGRAGGGGGARGDPDGGQGGSRTPTRRRSRRPCAGRTARTVAAHCQQVLAGIGFTTEHPFHRFLKRTIALEGLFGSADEIVLELGRRLLAARRVPTLIEL